MSSLTSQQINDSYQGLLKLADSTTGITSTLQSVQDGLGNDLPLKISTVQVQSPNLFSFQNFVPDYEGPGFTTVSAAYGNGSQNVLNGTPFYNAGVNSYSAITYNCGQVTSTSDVIDAAFYTTQFISGLGLQPKDLIMSGISLDVSSTGVRVTTLPSTLSFSAYGSGIYFLVVKISNSGVQPTARFTPQPSSDWVSVFSNQLGLQLNVQGSAMQSFSKMFTITTTALGMLYTIPDFQTSFSEGDFSGGVQSLAFNGTGFGLNVIK